jgi:hypothetical protein
MFTSYIHFRTILHGAIIAKQKLHVLIVSIMGFKLPCFINDTIDIVSHILPTSGHKNDIDKLTHLAAVAILAILFFVYATTFSSSQIKLTLFSATTAFAHL